MVWRGALFAAATLCFATSARAELGRDDQWTYVPAAEARGAQAELRGDRPEGVPSVLIFQFECVSAERLLVMRFFIDDAEEIEPSQLNDPLGMVVSLPDRDIVFSAPVRQRSDRLEGRLRLSSDMVATIGSAAFIGLLAPEAGGHLWSGGEAPALKRLVQECWERSVG